MRKMTLYTMLLVCALSSAAVYSVWAQSEASLVGVKAGDNFAYSFGVTWFSSNPDMPPPQELSDLNQTRSIRVNVTDASFSTVTAEVTSVMWDGTQNSDVGFIGVLSGSGTPNMQLLIIMANLTAGGTVYPQSDPAAVAAGAAAASFTITDTAIKTYLGANKTVNHYFARDTNATTGDYGEKDAYYDQVTGVLMEMTTKHYFASAEEMDTEQWKINQFNPAGTIPSDGGNNGTTSSGLPDWIVPVLIVLVIVALALPVAVLVLRRRKKPQTEVPSQAPVSAPPPTSA